MDNPQLQFLGQGPPQSAWRNRTVYFATHPGEAAEFAADLGAVGMPAALVATLILEGRKKTAIKLLNLFRTWRKAGDARSK